ncbi:MAG: urate hydroxylase PuuD [Elusimicrobia bacterium]|nr:urate hydroxylase PuuD [Elusimicrobiota bacterium]MBI3012436.1 urate hydroxylase PuuD [Elusimicrobiota bacterium]
MFEFLLRWVHLLSGITWIGFLYWLNLVNVNFQKNLEADVKPKVNPKLMPPTLWYFRWGAVLTVASGLLYYISILHGEPESGAWGPFFSWLGVIGVSYAILFNVIRPEGALNNGKVLAGVVSLLIVLMSAALFLIYKSLGVLTNPAYAIGIGGGMGLFMLLNVWGIIWPAQKRILGLVPVEEGVDKMKLARRAYLASRINFYLSIPMLLFMGVSTHLPLIRWY